MIETIKGLMDQYELVTWALVKRIGSGRTLVRFFFISVDGEHKFTTYAHLDSIDQETLLSLIEEYTGNGIRGRFLDSWYVKQGRALYDSGHLI